MVPLLLLVGFLIFLSLQWTLSSVQWKQFSDVSKYTPWNTDSMSTLLLVPRQEESSFQEELLFVK